MVNLKTTNNKLEILVKDEEAEIEVLVCTFSESKVVFVKVDGCEVILDSFKDAAIHLREVFKAQGTPVFGKSLIHLLYVMNNMVDIFK